MSETDVVVVGAGAAGIGAGLALDRLGVPFVILEAKTRIGGRAFTEELAPGLLFDHGCHWFHSAHQNPLRAIADRIAHRYDARPQPPRPVHLGARWADESERQEADDEIDAAFAAIYAAGEAGRDVAASTVLPPAGRFARLARHWIELMACFPPEAFSALDYARYRDGNADFPVADGYGRLIARLAAGLPIRCGTPVTGLAAMRDGVAITTPAGALRAKAAILTVPMSSYRDGRIALDPAPDPALAAAFDDVAMGLYEKVAILLDGNVLSDAETSFAEAFDESDPQALPVSFEVRPHGRPLIVAHVAGAALAQLRKAAPAALADHAVTRAKAAFGSSLAGRIREVRTTAFTDDPFIAGGYSLARPGRSAARLALIDAAIGTRILVAGEATHPHYMATCHGAYLTGLEAAAKAAVLAGREASPVIAEWVPAWAS
ncbi:MAG: FAD-dependent oxidoreductase [Hyphomicrobiaceae bacterium]